ncbi:hypothetical protein CEXT_381711 [Caerostris extrusa]|uniref:Uncharacterized protein n=1 Tax=Caerostris extrusa TaxID=172846 RepID=A0AAV4WDH8_CAEEX|nr:hypothetical protein CEXT_381711 [Caerostris extrusa]
MKHEMAHFLANTSRRRAVGPSRRIYSVGTKFLRRVVAWKGGSSIGKVESKLVVFKILNSPGFLGVDICMQRRVSERCRCDNSTNSFLFISVK